VIWGAGILKGLAISMRNMLRGPITVQYPYEKLELPERARWKPVHLRDENGEPKCTACGLCVKACPDHCISLEVITNEDKTKTIDSYVWEMGACMFCGLCEESCPFDALKMGHDYELATTDTAELFQTLIAGEPAARPKRRSESAEGAAAVDTAATVNAAGAAPTSAPAEAPVAAEMPAEGGERP